MKIRFLLVVAVLFILVFVLAPQISTGQRDIAALENIYGIPFPYQRESQIITEKLAHADIYLNTTPLAKKITLTITFTPHHTDFIQVGIRENAFWLSYDKHELFRSGRGEESTLTRTITIPLTDKIIDRNDSVDLMFFTSTDWDTEYEGIADTTYWELNNIDAQVSYTQPTATELKDYLKSKLNREKPV